jgi:hypothetical protein
VLPPDAGRRLVIRTIRGPLPALLTATIALVPAGFLFSHPHWWETAADMPIQLALRRGGSSAYRRGPIAP